MEIDVYTHTAIAIACLAGCYYWGRLLAKREILSEVVDTTLEKLEKEGFVRMEIDEDGDLSLIHI